MTLPHPTDALPDTTARADARQMPSVPISVYREIATELKATQALVSSLNQQNQRLDRDNQLLRQEILKFTEAAAQLKVMVDPSQGKSPQVDALSPLPLESEPSLATLGVQDLAPTMADPYPDSVVYSGGSVAVSGLASQFTKLLRPQAQPSPKPSSPSPTVKAKRKPPTPPRPKPQPATPVLHSEERIPSINTHQGSPRAADLSGLWLATTILLVVVSAFGAGFLVMKPLLNNSR
jgi:hypothetical protein